MKRIGILGGTFNPIHLGHLVMSEMAYERLCLDKVVFIPSYLPPHKSDTDIIAAKHRLQMTRLAIYGNPRFSISDIEVKRGGKSYTIDTVNYLQKTYPKGTKFYIIIGNDLVVGLSRWKRIKDLLKEVCFVAISRRGFEAKRASVPVQRLNMQDIEISSSDIRKRIGSGKSVRYLLPDQVRQYIKKYQLYR